MRRFRLLVCAALLLGGATARADAPPAETAAPAMLAAPANGPEVLALVRADRWADAQAAAARWLDPVAGKLVTYYRMTAPGAASLQEIDDFLAGNPDWPGRATLQRRREEALAALPDDAAALAWCDRLDDELHGAAALLRCAEARAHAGRPDAAPLARRAWVTGGLTDPAAEARFMQRWGGAVTPDDQWHRFDRLAWTDPAAASRQLLRLDLAHRRAGAARLALQRDDPGAPLILAQLPPELRADPALMLEEARRLRRTNQIGAALALWRGAGASAQRAAPADRLPAFWAERNLLARRLLQDGDAVSAEDLAADHGQTQPEAIADAEFLAGWIALRRLNDPDRAIPHFQRLAEISKAAITQGRAHYWLGRAQAARGDGAAAHADYAAAAAWPTTFYGQLGALALGEDPAALNARITARATADWTPAEALDVAGQELARAAILLTAWGEPYRARPFLLQLEAVAATPEQRAIAARLALGLGLPDQAVAMARRAGRDGLVLEDGWPAGLAPPGPVEAAVTLGLIRQESSFDPLALSPTGARGLMQLMPATAAEVAKRLAVQDVALSVTPDLTDPAANMRLGTAFLQGLLQRFGGSVPLALAAYNAGPNRVADWLATHGDPTQPGTGQPGATGIDMIDWIELIPFDETRNYVQRVVENIAVYRAREGVALPYPVALPPGRPAE